MTAAPIPRTAPFEVRHYLGAGYYLLIGETVELGCDDWPNDEGVYLQHMTPEDGHTMVAAFAALSTPPDGQATAEERA